MVDIHKTEDDYKHRVIHSRLLDDPTKDRPASMITGRGEESVLSVYCAWVRREQQKLRSVGSARVKKDKKQRE
jgi:hypothetical protein